MVWCYSGEDYMGKMRPMISSSTRGNTMWGVSRKALDKYRRAMDMICRDPEKWLRTLRK